MWVGTGSTYEKNNGSGGLNQFNKKTGKFIRYLHNEKDLHSLIDNRVRAIFEDSRGNFWVGTGGDGLHTMDRKTGKFERHLYDPLHPGKLSRPPVKNIFSFSDDYNQTCKYPRFWLETGEPVGSDVTDQMVGCYDSEFDQVCFPSAQKFLTYLTTSKSTVILRLSVSSRIGNVSCQNLPPYKIVSCPYFGLHDIY